MTTTDLPKRCGKRCVENSNLQSNRPEPHKIAAPQAAGAEGRRTQRWQAVSGSPAKRHHCPALRDAESPLLAMPMPCSATPAANSAVDTSKGRSLRKPDLEDKQAH